MINLQVSLYTWFASKKKACMCAVCHLGATSKMIVVIWFQVFFCILLKKTSGNWVSLLMDWTRKPKSNFSCLTTLVVYLFARTDLQDTNLLFFHSCLGYHWIQINCRFPFHIRCFVFRRIQRKALGKRLGGWTSSKNENNIIKYEMATQFLQLNLKSIFEIGL